MIGHEAIHQPFYLLPGFFPIPPKPYILPPYVDATTIDYESQSSIPTQEKLVTLDHRVLQFLDEL